MALGEAQVKITPDLGDFESRLVDGINSALNAASKAAGSAAAEIEGAFTGAAEVADQALAEVDGDGFGDAAASASAVASEVESAFDSAATASDAALTDIDGDGFTEATSGASKAGSDIEKAFDEAGKKSQTVLNRIDFKQATVAAGAFIAAFGAGRALIQAGEAAATANARIQQIATSMDLFGSEINSVTDRIIAYARETALATGVDQNAIKETQAKLLTFRDLAATADQMGGSFDRATMAAVDLAAAGFGSAESNAVQLGKALQDPIRGLSALARSGVTFTDVEKERIRTLVDSNQVMEAQSLILDAIEKQVGGTAVATSNATDRMAVSFSIVKEELGEALLPALDMVAAAMRAVLEMFTALPGPIKQVVTVVGLASVGFIAASKAIQAVGVAAGTANKALGAIGLILTGATVLYSFFTRSKQDATKATDELTSAILRERDGHKGATDEVIRARLTNDALVQSADTLGISLAELDQFIRTGVSPAFEELNTRYAELRSEAVSVDNQQHNIQKAFGLSNGKVVDFMKSINGLRQEYEDSEAAADLNVRVTGELGTEMEETTEVVIDYTAALADVERQSKLVSDALSANRDRVLQWRDGLDSATKKGAESFATFEIKANTSIKNFEDMLLKSIEDTMKWQDNLLLIAQQTSPEFAAYLAEFGPAASGLIAKLAETGDGIEDTFDIWLRHTEVMNRNVLGEFDKTPAGIQRRMDDVRAVVTTTLEYTSADARERAVLIGREIMMGLVTGIANGEQSLVYAAAGMVNTAVATAKDTAGIRSPSTVFANEVGAPIAQGVADGIMSTIVEAKDAMVMLVTDLSDVGVDALEDFTANLQDVLKTAQNAYDEVWDTIKGRRSQEQATKRVTDAEKSLADANRKVTDATEAVNEAQAELTRVQLDGSSTAKDIAAAQRDLDRAQRDLTNATRDVEQSTKSLQDANFALLQMSEHLLEQGPESIKNFENIAKAAGLETDEIAKLVTRYNELATSRIAAADAAKKAAEVDKEVAKIGQVSATDAANQAVRDAVAERNRLLAEGKNASGAESRAAQAAINAAKVFAQSSGALAGSKAFAQKELDALRFIIASTPWLGKPLKGVVDALSRQIGLADGAIVNGARLSVIGEAGPEAVIPLGRPRRAMQLMEQSGLADMARGSNGALVNIQSATFATPSDADLVAQKVNAAYRSRVLVS